MHKNRNKMSSQIEIVVIDKNRLYESFSENSTLSSSNLHSTNFWLRGCKGFLVVHIPSRFRRARPQTFRAAVVRIAALAPSLWAGRGRCGGYVGKMSKLLRVQIRGVQGVQMRRETASASAPAARVVAPESVVSSPSILHSVPSSFL